MPVEQQRHVPPRPGRLHGRHVLPEFPILKPELQLHPRPERRLYDFLQLLLRLLLRGKRVGRGSGGRVLEGRLSPEMCSSPSNFLPLPSFRNPYYP